MPYLPARAPDYQGAQHYALERLERELSSSLLYHSLWHTKDEVSVRAVWLAQQEGLSPELQHLVGCAAVFHDLAFVDQRADHETASARIAAEMLPHFGFRPSHIQLIQGMILATKLPQTAHNRLEEILADADLDVLGRHDFFSRNLALRSELARSGLSTTDELWYVQQLHFMQMHRYFTKTASRERTHTKQRNMQQLRSILADCGSQTHDGPIPVPSPRLAAH
jgi:uncharacterized protein